MRIGLSVHGDIRHLEKLQGNSELEGAVHGDIRHLEKIMSFAQLKQ